LERARRLEDLAVQVMTAVGERDAGVAEAEKRAGAALREMTKVEGVTLRAAVEWCGDRIGVREATRLRRLADNGREDGATALAATAANAAGEGAGGGTAASLPPTDLTRPLRSDS